MPTPESAANWEGTDAAFFSAYSECLVPERQTQLHILSRLAASVHPLSRVVDLCCGDGELMQILLHQHPTCEVWGLDQSQWMLHRASRRLSGFQDRFQLQSFDLGAAAWRRLEADVFLSSLAIHHLPAEGKRILFQDLHDLLRPGGLLAIADVIRPTRATGFQLAAESWDRWTKEQTETLPQVYRTFTAEQWNYFAAPDADPTDQPSGLYEQLRWLQEAGFVDVDVFWLSAGHAIFGGWKNNAS